ncbi:DUF3307 domain-containing protein [bacterium]|nr:DUF3307 domain-containing protein [bacterium]
MSAALFLASVVALIRPCAEAGDYVLQNHEMASRKTTSMRWAVIHACFYGVPFVGLYGFIAAYLDRVTLWMALGLFVQLATHAVIDRYRLAAKWCSWFGVGYRGRFYTGEAPDIQDPPDWLRIWLMIRADNVAHAFIDTACVLAAVALSMPP